MHSRQMNIVSFVRISKDLLHKMVHSEAHVVTIKPAICLAWELERQFMKGGRSPDQHTRDRLNRSECCCRAHVSPPVTPALKNIKSGCLA